ncbi:MAG: hypothetical protein AMJ46_11595 [Latescibacteria bacterium DG_63]|nr:MAG: hypothetical protein AMJ46_11595 [Latescibacteria bacterium DG_63]
MGAGRIAEVGHYLRDPELDCVRRVQDGLVSGLAPRICAWVVVHREGERLAVGCGLRRPPGEPGYRVADRGVDRSRSPGVLIRVQGAITFNKKHGYRDSTYHVVAVSKHTEHRTAFRKPEELGFHV